MCQVTIGLCVKNAEKTIKETLYSVINQDFPHEDMEIIAVDGHSKDETTNIIIDNLSKMDINFKVYFDNGRGLAAARQIVVNNARGKYIVWVDSDVVLSKDFVKRQLDFISKNTNVSVVIGQREHIELEGKVIDNTTSLFWCLLRNVYFGATICRTQALREVGGFDQRIKGASEDNDIVFRMILAQWKLKINPEARFFHKQKETLTDLVNRGAWYGYGGYFMSRKYEGLIKIPYRLPPAYFGWGLKLSSKAFRKYHMKKSFLIPIVCLFFSIGWCLGYILGHIYGCGHLIKNHEIKKKKVLFVRKELRTL